MARVGLSLTAPEDAKILTIGVQDRPRPRIVRWFQRHKHALFLTMTAMEMTYLFTTIPLRIAFFFDPYAEHRSTTQWTLGLMIYSLFDVLTEFAAIVNIKRVFHAQRRAVAANVVEAETINIRQRRPNPKALQRLHTQKSSLIVWSLNTIAPAMKLQLDIKQPLLYEAIAMFPLELLAFTFGPNSLHVLRTHKLFRLHRVGSCVMEIKNLHARNKIIQMFEFPGSTILLRRIALGLVVTHVVACVYMALAHWQCGLDFQMCTRGIALSMSRQSGTVKPRRYTCWAIEDQLVGATPLRKYARSIYFASRSMLNVGNTDTVPITDLETIYVIVVEVISALFSTTMLASFIFLFKYLNYRKQIFIAHVDEAKEYMKMSKIPDDVRDNVLTFYNNVWEANASLTPGDIVQNLPGHLRVRVTSILVTQRIQQVPFLAKETIEFVNTLSLKMEPHVYSEKDWIIEKLADGMFFIIRGNVVIESMEQSEPRYAKAGEHFAEYALLYPSRDDDRARAQTYCELYKLSQSWFQETMELFHRRGVSERLEQMRSMLNRRDQQQQKMKRMLGRTTVDPGGEHDRTVSGGGPSLGGLGKLPWRMPGSAFRKWWELMRLVLLTFVSYEVPFFIVFDTVDFPFTKTPTYNIQSLTSLLGEIFFTADFVLRCRYYIYIDPLARIPVYDSSFIFEWYKTRGMWLDLISIIPVSTVLEFSYGAKWMIGPAFRLVRMLRLRHFPTLIQDISQTRGLSSRMQFAITLILMVTLSFHITGCIWFLMARLSINEDTFDAPSANLTRTDCLRDVTIYGNCSWAVFDAYGQIKEGFPVHPVGQASIVYSSKFAYLRSIYWAVVVLTTVGYGDIVAYTTQETFFAAFWIFIGGIINYAVVAAMSNLASNWTTVSRTHMEKTNTANLIFARYHVTDKVRTQIRRHYHQQFHIQKVASEAKLLAHLPQRLRHRISLILHSESVKKIPLFVDYGNARLLNDITGQFRRAVYQRGDFLAHENTICNEAFVIISGQANTFCKRLGNVPVGALHVGSSFGVAAMILRLNAPSTAIAASVVEVSSITYKAFSASVEQLFPTDVLALKAQASDQYSTESRTNGAIVRNLQGYKKLRHSKRCTTMFVSTDKLNNQAWKEQVRFYWDTVIMVITTFHGLEVPFRISFLHHPDDSTRSNLLIVNLVFDLLLWIDILLKLYYFECDAGVWNIFTREIRNRNYAHHMLKKDLWSQLPLYYVGENFVVMSLCRLPRLIRLSQLSSAIDSFIIRLHQRASAYGDVSAYLRPFKLLLILIFVSHLGGCLFYLVSEVNAHHPNSWIHHDTVVVQENSSTYALYLRSFYWALTTFTLVGTREIAALDTISTLIAGLLCLSCTFIIGVILGELSDLVLDLDKTKKQLHEHESSFEEFAKEHDLPILLRTRATRYLRFHYSYAKGMNIYKTFADLPRNLRVLLMMDLHGSLLRRLPITRYLSETLIQDLSLHLTSELQIKGDNVVVEGDPGLKLYVLKKGSAQVVWKSADITVAKIGTGYLFGEIAFFLKNIKRTASVQMIASGELLVLHRRSWKNLMDSCAENERRKAKTSILQWVRDCLSRYNGVNMEILHDIKSLVRSGGNMGIDYHGPHSFLWRNARKATKHLGTVMPNQDGFGPRLSTLLGLRGPPKIHITTSHYDESQNESKGPRTGLLPPRRSSFQRVVRPFLQGSEVSKRRSLEAARGQQHALALKRLEHMEIESWRHCQSIVYLATSLSKNHLSVSSDQVNEGLVRAASAPRIQFIPAKVDTNPVSPALKSGQDTSRTRSSSEKVPIRWGFKRGEQPNTPKHVVVATTKRTVKRGLSLPGTNNAKRPLEEKARDPVSSLRKQSAMKDTPQLEMLHKAQQPEFLYLFQLYLKWRVKRVDIKPTQGKPSNLRVLKRSASRRRWSVFPFSSTQRKPNALAEDHAQAFFELLSRCHRLWECVGIFIAVYYAMSLPMLISFSSRTETPPGDERVGRWNILVVFVDVVCLVDFIFKYTVFRYVKNITGEDDDGKAFSSSIINVKVVLDLFATLPFDWLLFLPTFKSLCSRKWYYLSLFQLNKITRIDQAREASERLAQVLAYDLKLPVHDSTLRYFRSIGTFLLFGHWIACLWYFGSIPAYEHYGISWLSTPKMLAVDQFTSIADVSYWRRYLRSAHFAAGSISTVFYGDIGSANLVETIYELVIIVVSIFIFGMLAGAHSEHLEAKYKHQIRFEQDLVELYHYLKENEVPREIRTRLKLYYRNTWLKYHGHDDLEGVQGLSTLLVEDIVQNTMHDFSTSVSVFKSCDECFLRALLTCLKHIICSPSEQIVRKGDVDRSMYFISQGKILVEGTGFQLVKEEGDFFGELSLLYGIPRSATCSSLGTSLLYVLEREAYERVLLDYPEYRQANRRDWVIVSTKLPSMDTRFHAIIDVVSRMETADWVQVDEIIRKAKSLKS